MHRLGPLLRSTGRAAGMLGPPEARKSASSREPVTGPASARVLSLVLLRARPLLSFLLAFPPRQNVTWGSSGPGSSVGMVRQPEGARWVAQGWLSPGDLGSRGPGFGGPSGGCGWPSSREQQAAAGSRSGWSEPPRAAPISGCCRCGGRLGGGGCPATGPQPAQAPCPPCSCHVPFPHRAPQGGQGDLEGSGCPTPRSRHQGHRQPVLQEGGGGTGGWGGRAGGK